ncbi:DUF5803 family protein [Halomicrobium katesii]|uniref:DUF5803 family protein n=1 Tax=Halomicrobium katesii TaxID=437163 RepID=UPI0003639CB9|nr:DUF5803 family protein [Halomicrobium katesii]
MRRRGLALAAVLALVALSGCTSLLGPGEPDPQRLNESADYDWDSSVNASITLEKNASAHVYGTENRSELRVYERDALGQEAHLEIRALQYRYPNGTVVTADHSALSVSQTRERTIVDVPNETAGQVAFTAPRQGKRYSTPVFVEGATNLTLPPGARVGVPLLSQVNPPAGERSVTDDRMTLTYENVTAQTIRVRYYLQRDLLIFGSLFGGGIVLAIGGSVYYWRQIQSLKRKREETAIDIDTDGDDFGDDGPPPGMR